MARLNTGNDILTLQKEIERLRYQLLQYKTLLGVCPFNKQELKGDQGGIGPRGLRGENGEIITNRHDRVYNSSSNNRVNTHLPDECA